MDLAALFAQRLDDVRRWDSRRARPTSPRDAMRSQLFRPHPLYALYEPRKMTLAEQHEFVAAEVERVCLMRSAHVARSQKNWNDCKGYTQGGRIIAYEPDRNGSDGAPEAASEGFFDEDAEPPWDCWLWYAKEKAVVYAWVPPDFVALAERGIEVDGYRCLYWADDPPSL